MAYLQIGWIFSFSNQNTKSNGIGLLWENGTLNRLCTILKDQGNGWCIRFVTGIVSQVAPVVMNLPANEGDEKDMGLIPGPGRSPGGRHGYPLHCSGLENSMDRGAWWAKSMGLQSQT